MILVSFSSNTKSAACSAGTVSPSHPEHLRSPQFLVGFTLVDREYSVYCFVDRCLSFCPFSFGLCKNDDKTKTKKNVPLNKHSNSFMVVILATTVEKSSFYGGMSGS